VDQPEFSLSTSKRESGNFDEPTQVLKKSSGGNYFKDRNIDAVIFAE
jgi:hypothetical protein